MTSLAPVRAARLLVLAARRAGTLATLAFDPQQPRDDRGRWTNTGTATPHEDSRTHVDPEITTVDGPLDFFSAFRTRLQGQGRARKFMIQPRTNTWILGPKDDPEGNYQAHATILHELQERGEVSDELAYDTFLRGQVSFLGDRATIQIINRTGAFLPGGDDDPQSALFDATYRVMDKLVAGGAPANTRVELERDGPWERGTLGEMFPSLFKRRKRDLAFNPDQPRDDHGRWTDTGGSAPAPAPAGILDAIQQADGGFTYHAVTGAQPTTGFALSLHKDRERVLPAKDATVVALAEYAAQNWDLLSQDNNYLGGWHNPANGQAYLDVSTVVQSAEEAERLGRAAQQEAYFDLQQGQSVPISYVKAAASRVESHWPTRRTPDARGSHCARAEIDWQRAYARGYREGSRDSRVTIHTHTVDDPFGLRLLDFDPNQPRDEQGQWTDTGANVEQARLSAEADKGIQAIDALVQDVVEHASFETPSDEEENWEPPEVTWEDLDSDAQTHARQRFFEEKLDEGSIDVDTSALDEEFKKDLQRDNDDIIEQTEIDVLEQTAETFPHSAPSLPLGEDYRQFYQIDRETLTVDDEGYLTDRDQIRFKDGTALTEAEQEQLADVWAKNYDDNFEAALQKVYESDAYYEQRDELEREALEQAWENLDDAEKFDYASDDAKIEASEAKVDDRPEAERVTPGLPERWVLGTESEVNTEDHVRTRAMAHALVTARTEQLLKERGLTGSATALVDETWESWKVSSSSERSLAFQLASARELGGVHRIDADTVARLDKNLGPYMEKLQAYARAQWETTQFLMDKAGQQDIAVYRGLMLPGSVVRSARLEVIEDPQRFAGGFSKLPDLTLQRAGLQSTTSSDSVANNWGGVGNLPPDPVRVVLRLDVPRTAVMSLPVFGKNVHSEKEVVVIGTKDRWSWDAWFSAAPRVDQVPLPKVPVIKRQPRAAAAAKRRPSKRLVIDLQRIDAGQPHWLSNAAADRIKAKQRARRRRVPRVPRVPRALAFDPNQPRDESGRWTDTGAAALKKRSTSDDSLRTPIPTTGTAKVLGQGGINGAKKLVTPEGKEYLYKPAAVEQWIFGDSVFADHAGGAGLAERETLASRVAQEMGFDRAPTAFYASVPAELGGNGVVMEWVDHAEPLFEVSPTHEVTWRHKMTEFADAQRAEQVVFDTIIGNVDRHSGNFLVKDGQLVAIDHGYTFGKTVPSVYAPDDVYPDADLDRMVQTFGQMRNVAAAGLNNSWLSREAQLELANRVEGINWARVLQGSHLSDNERQALRLRTQTVINRLRAGEFGTLADDFVWKTI